MSYKIVLLVSLVFASVALVAHAHDYEDRDVPGTVDFIVLGVGTSGSVVASQLAKAKKSNGQFKYDVLALDIGRDLTGKEVTTNPGNWQTIKGSEADWDITIASGEPKAFLIDADKRHITQGRVLGGSSAINSAMYVRGDPADYNRWAVQNPGWSYTDVLPYFKALENNANKYGLNPAYHGNSGPLFVNGSLYHPKMQLYLDAAANFGLTYNPDINGDHLVIGNKGSIGRIDNTVKDGIRQNAYQSFLLPIKDQDNLFLRDQSFVLKINFQGKVAKSVDWFDTISREVKTTKARKEIILSLGALRSAQALILSGVGAKAEVEAIDVPLVHNLPGVGKNLQDHPIATFSSSQPASVAACEGSGRDPRLDLWFRTSFKEASDPRPDIETIGSNACGGAFSLVYLMNPKSRGYIRVTSADATSRPIPVMNYFNDPQGHDLKALMEGMRLTRDFFATAPLSATSSGPSAWDDWTLSNYILGSAWSAPNTNSGNHMAGTCKMGPSSDATAVVDHRLRVHGLQRLRVVDNSIQPEITSGNTQAPAYLIGYKGAAMILEDNN